jgi:DNA adenine methylase
MADTIIKRVGGKVKLRDWIKRLLPKHTLYCEPFGGSFAVGFVLPKTDGKYRLIYNDLDSHVWNLFRVLREHKDAFIEKVELTPYSREDFEKAVEYIESKRDFIKENPVEWARNYLIYNRQSMFGKEDGTWCVSRTGENICLSWAGLPRFIDRCARFFKGVYIENLDYKECIKKWDCPEALFYLDPPYENVEKMFYHVNMTDGFIHEDMAKYLDGVQGSIAISYYYSPSIENLYPASKGYTIYRKSVVKHMQTLEEKDSAEEILIVKKSSYAMSGDKQQMCF